MYSPEQLQEFLQKHKAAFESQYIGNLGKNSTAISRDDLNSIKQHLDTSTNLSPNLKKRIKSKKMFLVPFPNSTNEVCTASEEVYLTSQAVGRQVNKYFKRGGLLLDLPI